MTPYQRIVEYWLKVHFVGYYFRAVDGKKINSIIKQLEFKLKQTGKETTDDLIVDSFIMICQRLPKFYQNKDLSIIDSKLNQIIEEIKNERKQRVNSDFERIANAYLQSDKGK